MDKYNTLVDRTGYLGSRIRVSLGFLCNHSTSLPEVVDQLFSHGLLSEREAELVENKGSNYVRFLQLFIFLIPKLAHWDNAKHFVNAFQQSGNEHILEELKRAVVTKEFDPRCAETSLQSIRFNVREPVPSFFGRENFLRDLDQQILQIQRTSTAIPTTSRNISRICVVTGLGGIGKTETIRKYIHCYGHFYQHVIWIDAEEHATAENQFRKLALQELKLSSTDLDNKAQDFDVLLKEIYVNLCTTKTLLVFDNAEALYDSNPKRPGVARFLQISLPPNNLKPVIIITSRQLDWPDLHPIPIPHWTPQESSAFLFRQLNLKKNHANAKNAETLSDIFGGLPLALQAAAAVILQQSKRNKLMGKDVYTIQHLLSDYSEGKREVLKNRPPGSPNATPLMLLLKVSLDKIRQQPHGHLATQILNVMAHLSPTNIPKDLIFFIFNSEDSDSLVDAVELLVDYSIVQDCKAYFSIHRMLQDVTLAHFEAHTDGIPEEDKLLFLTHPLVQITTALKKYWPTVPKSSEAYDAVHENLIYVTMSHVLTKAQNPSEKELPFVEFIEFVFEEIKHTRWVEAEKCCRALIAYFTSSALPCQSASHFKSTNFTVVRRLRRQLARILKMMGRSQGNPKCRNISKHQVGKLHILFTGAQPSLRY